MSVHGVSILRYSGFGLNRSEGFEVIRLRFFRTQDVLEVGFLWSRQQFSVAVRAWPSQSECPCVPAFVSLR